MSEALKAALTALLEWQPGDWSAESDQRRAIYLDLLWKLVRKDYHGVADCAMDLRELRL